MTQEQVGNGAPGEWEPDVEWGEPGNEGIGDDAGYQSGGSSGVPGVGDVFMERGNPIGRGFDPVRYIGRGSLAPEEYLPMTRLSDQELARLVRIDTLLNLVNFGTVDLPQAIWYFLQGRVAVDGAGRQEVVDMVIGHRMQQEERRLRGLGASRGRSNRGAVNRMDSMAGGRNRGLSGPEW